MLFANEPFEKEKNGIDPLSKAAASSDYLIGRVNFPSVLTRQRQ